MTLSKPVRELIKSHYQSGKTAIEIFHLLNKTVPKRTIYRWVASLKRKNSVEPIRRKFWPKKVTSKEFIKKVKRNVKTNRVKKSPRQVAFENNCSEKTVRLVIKNKLGLKKYRKVKVPHLTTAHIEKRLKFARWVRKHFNRETQKKIMFSDEKLFDADGSFNPQNDVVYAESRSEANIDFGLETKRKFPPTVMVWAGITFNGVTSLVILPPKTSFDSEFYIKNVIPLANKEGRRLIGDNFVYQQDGATCHTSAATITVLKDTVPSFIDPSHWPPNSPDLNPMDYFFWNELSNGLKGQKYNSREDLIKKIKIEVKKIPLEKIRDSILQFRSRCYWLEKQKGGLLINKFK